MTKADIRQLQTNAGKALKKAVKKAIAQHESAGVPAVIWQNGKVVRLSVAQPMRRRRHRSS